MTPSSAGRVESEPRVDSLSMWEITASLPEQIAQAVEVARAIEPLPQAKQIDSVVVLGMGGSGIAGDVLAGAAASACPVPVSVVKSYELPAFVGPHTLVFAVSCSGNTEETLSSTEAAFAAGAAVVVVSAGGELGSLAGRHGVPMVAVPATIPQPRAAIGAMSVPLLVIADRLGLLVGATDQLTAALGQLASRRDLLMGPKSPAREIARRIDRTMPLIHGAQGLPAVAASRWKTQINENAKAPAFWSASPELCHNEIAGWAQYGDMTRQVITAIELRTVDEHPQVARRFAWVSEMLLEVVGDLIEVWAQGDSPLARFFDLVLVGDVVSLVLAEHDGVDPGPVPILSELKDYLQT